VYRGGRRGLLAKSWPSLGSFLQDGAMSTGLRSILMVFMYNGRATDSNRVTMQCLHWINVIHVYVISHTVLPNIVKVHKQVKIEMDNRSTPPHKLTNLCQEVMWLKSSPKDGSKPLFNAIIPIVSEYQWSAIIAYHTDPENQVQHSRMVLWVLAECYEIQARNGVKVDGEF
jgi:hypothetical protein